ncbi:hypothetical protein J6590_072096 [Homalodisca vitripennis]|nr:hypothetical protein J6590_072096 [Homalodisca vitripennis]
MGHCQEHHRPSYPIVDYNRDIRYNEKRQLRTDCQSDQRRERVGAEPSSTDKSRTFLTNPIHAADSDLSSERSTERERADCLFHYSKSRAISSWQEGPLHPHFFSPPVRAIAGVGEAFSSRRDRRGSGDIRAGTDLPDSV